MDLFLSLSCLLLLPVSANVLPRLENGLAITPPMGWNSYNHYSCSPNESIIRSNAQALVDLGLQSLGYEFVTVDCGWTLPARTAEGTLPWNPDRFPNGFPALGEYIHGLGLKFGVYSDAGIRMCMTGEPEQVGSLFHEETDAQTFASWGADLLKYDNCFSEEASGYPNTDYNPVASASGRYANMTRALAATNRPIVFQICNWGVDFPSAWAPDLGNSWRIANDIIPAYRTIPRILNQAVPQTSFAGPGRWLDLDMLEVGNNVFTIPEEQTHFSLWAIIKSPLVIGAALKDTSTSINAESLAILKNKDVIGYNQDPLGVAASFRRRWTEEGYEVWAGELSGERTVVAVINLKNEARELTLDLPDAGVQRAGWLKDIWNNAAASDVLTSYTAPVGAHGTILLELGNTTVAGTYDAKNAAISGDTTTFTNIYGSTTSASYTGTLAFSSSSQTPTTVTINSIPHPLPANTKSLTFPLTLNASTSNTLIITSPLPPTLLSIKAPDPSFYPATSFTPSGTARLTSCHPNLCAPVGSKISFLSSTGSASLSLSSPPDAPAGAGPKRVTVSFTNNDVALATAWGFGTNTRNLTIGVNGVVARIEVPLSGTSSELFSEGKGWEDTGVFEVLLEGWREGENVVVVGNAGGGEGLVDWGADFVGLDVWW
ncbi:uncharacterized protein L3040_008142 [Drepanopeziza brunnea f. sp. 'multigermtubi']|uniref:uncharacterized protein n=1 Tax=Drepanopeziza brunnea f. sp. 'multigermtubi' TaxID=698441 RepID=UPI0023A3BED9|nr:hypothetical protein L3040_008142 [Drepanopeziza brunnea f. sp. 'multigermtubi']